MDAGGAARLRGSRSPLAASLAGGAHGGLPLPRERLTRPFLRGEAEA